MILDRSKFDYSDATKTFVAYSSDLQLRSVPSAFQLKMADGKELQFDFSHKDMSGGDTAGWNYKQLRGDRKALIINT